MPRQRADTTAADILADAGRVLYGEHWRMPLSEAIGIHPETVRRFMSGRMAVPPEVLGRVTELVLRRIDELEAVVEKIEAMRS